MGSIKKALKPITKVVDDIIPNEIKPALPYIAATFGAPYLSPLVGKGLGALATRMGAGTGLKAFLTSAPLAKGLAGGLANIGTRAALGKKFNPASALFSAATIGGGQYLKGLEPEFAKSLGKFISPDKLGGMNLTQVSSAATTPLTAGTAESAYDAAKKANDEYEQYLAEQEAAGNTDIQTRADYISRYMGLAGFDQDKINETLNDLGYAANGGLMGTRVAYENGGDTGTLGDSMDRIMLGLMKDKLIDALGGFDSKDLDDMSDDDIIKLFYEKGLELAKGGRVGYKIGGSTMQNVMARLLNIEVPAERLEEMRQNRADFLFNENVDAEDYPSQDYLNKVRDAAEKQATKELEEYMKKIGMDPLNPPEDSMSDKLIDQIMEPRKEGRVKEAKGGRIGLKEGGTGDVLFDTYRDAFSELIGYPGYIIQDEQEFSSKLLDDPKFFGPGSMLDMEDFRKERFGPDSPIAKYLKRLPEEERKEALKKLRDFEADYRERSRSEEEKYLEKRGYMAEGGIMDLKMGGMPAEMDLRGGGFVPIGAKEKADDVPARLSKNEFVMTADAVRAAGGGSVNKGAKRMYDLMNKLEARV